MMRRAANGAGNVGPVRGVLSHGWSVDNHERNRALLAAIALCASDAAVQSKSASVFLEDTTSTAVRARLEAGRPVGIVFNGGSEATGPALALGKHRFRAHAYGEALARTVGDTIVAPIQPLLRTKGTMAHLSPFDAFAGTISISPAIFAALNEQIARSPITGGFRRIALLGDHGDGQTQPDEVAAKLDAEFALV
jgi:creatinine amidohydrolase/Fe(II)-dependent formamide hydrolase-like protein